jgi:hypothetical protein
LKFGGLPLAEGLLLLAQAELTRPELLCERLLLRGELLVTRGVAELKALAQRGVGELTLLAHLADLLLPQPDVHAEVALRLGAAAGDRAQVRLRVGVVARAVEVGHGARVGLAVLRDATIGEVGFQRLLALLPLRVQARGRAAVDRILRTCALIGRALHLLRAAEVERRLQLRRALARRVDGLLSRSEPERVRHGVELPGLRAAGPRRCVAPVHRLRELLLRARQQAVGEVAAAALQRDL